MPTQYFDKLKKGEAEIRIQDTISGYQTAAQVDAIIAAIMGDD